MENKYLQIKKENIFSKFVNFIKGIFGMKVEQEIPSPKEIIEKKEIKSTFLDELKIERQEDPELIKLQNQFENKEIDLCVISDEEIKSLNSLYKRQISDLKEKLDDKKTQLAIIKSRIKNYSTGI